jgi:hypothetical protein
MLKTADMKRKTLQIYRTCLTMSLPVNRNFQQGMARQILFELAECRFLSEVKKEADKEIVYQPDCDVDVPTVKYIIDALEANGNTNIPVVDSSELGKLTDCLQTFSSAIEESPANITLKQI